MINRASVFIFLILTSFSLQAGVGDSIGTGGVLEAILILFVIYCFAIYILVTVLQNKKGEKIGGGAIAGIIAASLVAFPFVAWIVFSITG